VESHLSGAVLVLRYFKATANSESGFHVDKVSGLRGVETGGEGRAEKTVARRLTGGDFSTSFRAAGPYTYDKSVGGGAWNDGTVGDGPTLGHDIKAELEGANLGCSSIVSYLLYIELDDDVYPASQTVEFDFTFTSDSTGQSGAGHISVVAAEINYGPVENGGGGGVGTYGLDEAISDDGGSNVSILSSGIYNGGVISDPFVSGFPQIELKLSIDDLEASEIVILRIDVQLGCQADSSPTGNLQAKLVVGHVMNNDSPADPLDSVNTFANGAQTVNIQKVGDFPDVGVPLPLLIKTVTAGDTCPGSEEITVVQGTTVTYCYQLFNLGTAHYYDVVLVDDNGTPYDFGDDFTVRIVVRFPQPF
jgi:hypothetical protein